MKNDRGRALIMWALALLILSLFVFWLGAK